MSSGVEEDGEAAGEGRGGGRGLSDFVVCRCEARWPFVLVNKKMQKAAGAKVGAMVDFTIAPDLEERTPRFLRSWRSC